MTKNPYYIKRVGIFWQFFLHRHIRHLPIICTDLSIFFVSLLILRQVLIVEYGKYLIHILKWMRLNHRNQKEEKVLFWDVYLSKESVKKLTAKAPRNFKNHQYVLFYEINIIIFLKHEYFSFTQISRFPCIGNIISLSQKTHFDTFRNQSILSINNFFYKSLVNTIFSQNDA